MLQMSTVAQEGNKMTINNILKKVFRNGYEDDHGNGVIVPTAVVLHQRWGDVSVAPVEENQNQAINPIYVDGEDGLAHLSTRSEGGVLRARGTTLEEAVAKYNRVHSFHEYVEKGALFSQLTLIKKEDFLSLDY